MSIRDFSIRYHKSILQPDGSYIDRNGRIDWFNEEGESHREDGPAVIHKPSEFGWRLNDVIYSFNDWLKLTPIPDEHKLILRLQYE
jgi:hypothetical protein